MDTRCKEGLNAMTATLNFSLPDEMKRWVEERVASGGYGNTSEYIRELIRLDRKRSAEERLDALLMEGLGSLDAGKGIAITPEYWEKKRQLLLRRHKSKTPRKKKSV